MCIISCLLYVYHNVPYKLYVLCHIVHNQILHDTELIVFSDIYFNLPWFHTEMKPWPWLQQRYQYCSTSLNHLLLQSWPGATKDANWKMFC